MRILADTHILIWALTCTSNLTNFEKKALLDPANEVFFSSISVAEIEIKQSIGKLAVPLDDFIPELVISGYIELPFTSSHASMLAELPLYHRDPFDRFLIAQARYENLFIMTRDRKFNNYDVQLVVK
jgi:PIN domain nuclease of toxin-antitoxin system